MGKFIRREERITHDIKEKRVMLSFTTQSEEEKYYTDIIGVANSKLRELRSKKVINGEIVKESE